MRPSRLHFFVCMVGVFVFLFAFFFFFLICFFSVPFLLAILRLFSALDPEQVGHILGELETFCVCFHSFVRSFIL